jgi:hypothetical protein
MRFLWHFIPVFRSGNAVIAVFLILMYLGLPAAVTARTISPEAGLAAQQTVADTSTTSPCDTCPCSDGHDADCCDTTGCSCACHAPLGQGVRLAYAPVVAVQSFPEPFWSLPQVYRTIFVPPQNLA